MSNDRSKPELAESPTAGDLPAAEMGLDEMMRVMDVATTLRREQELVEREFNQQQARQILREKLIRTAELTGEPLTAEQVEAAVDWYYDHLHEYRDPPRSISLFLAHLYVRRQLLGGWLFGILILTGTIWALWFASFAPFSSENQIRVELATLQNRLNEQLESVKSIPAPAESKAAIEGIELEIAEYFAQQNLEKLNDVAVRLDQLQQRLNEENETQRRLADAQARVHQHVKSIRAVAADSSVVAQVDDLESLARAQHDSGDLQRLQETANRLERIETQINEEYTITIVGGENQRSGFERFFEDEQGKRISGYYLVVEARTRDGSVLPQAIRNVETDKVRRVRRWAERVPKPIYDRLVKDKKEDGILNENLFARKRAGAMEIEMVLAGENQKPIGRDAQITDW